MLISVLGSIIALESGIRESGISVSVAFVLVLLLVLVLVLMFVLVVVLVHGRPQEFFQRGQNRADGEKWLIFGRA